MISVIRKHNPDIRFNLKMITRDPLKIRCLTEKYWATFDKIAARELTVFRRKIKEHKSEDALPRISNRSTDEQLVLKIENNETSVLFAKKNYGFS